MQMRVEVPTLDNPNRQKSLGNESSIMDAGFTTYDTELASMTTVEQELTSMGANTPVLNNNHGPFPPRSFTRASGALDTLQTNGDGDDANHTTVNSQGGKQHMWAQPSSAAQTTIAQSEQMPSFLSDNSSRRVAGPSTDCALAAFQAMEASDATLPGGYAFAASCCPAYTQV
jgi:hypothetical protein